MITLYHSPNSRSSRIVQLLMEMDVLDQIELKVVTCVARGPNGPVGQADPANPHPEGKVPLLVDGGVMIRESNAIMQYLCEVFASDLAPAVGAANRGHYLAWMAYYGNVIEPVTVATLTGLDHPGLHATFRGQREIAAALADALTDQPYLLGDAYSAADLLLASMYSWMPALIPESAPVQDWVRRCLARPSQQAVLDFDAAHRPLAA